MCQPGFHGEDCSEVACPDHCSHHGVCTDGSCLCYDGWMGSACSLRSCPNDCSERGTCINGTCDCVPPWSGTDCAYQPCPNNCSGVGVCRRDAQTGSEECYCPTGYTGADCATQVYAARWSRHGSVGGPQQLGAMQPRPPHCRRPPHRRTTADTLSHQKEQTGAMRGRARRPSES